MPADDDHMLQHHVPCPGCGYDVVAQVAKGIRRCPECGQAFDPVELSQSFEVKWPVLMKWVLLARILSGVIRGSIDIQHHGGFTEALAVRSMQFTEILLFAIFGSIAAIGLHRHQEWGRKACMVTFAMVALVRVLEVPFQMMGFGVHMDGSTSTPPLELILWCWPSVIPRILIILFLGTGLRRHTFTGLTGQRVLLLSRRVFEPRKDWLLLVVVILVGCGAASIGTVVWDWSTQDLYLAGPAGVQHLYRATQALDAACVLWPWVLAVLVWKYPEVIRFLLAFYVALVGLAGGCGSAMHCLWMIYGPHQSTMSTIVLSVSAVWIGRLLPTIALLAFAVWRLTAADIQSVTPRSPGT